MERSKKITVLCLLFFPSLTLVLPACTAPAVTFIPLNRENVDKIHSLKIYCVLRQEKVTARVDLEPETGGKSAGMYFGAVGVAIGGAIDAVTTSHRTNIMETRIAPLRAAVSDYNLKEEFWSQLRLELKNSTRFNIQDIVTTTQPLSQKNRTSLIHDMNEDALLIIDTSYSLSPGFDILSMDSIISLWLKGEKDQIYLETINYNSRPLPENGDAAIAKWAENNGARFRDAVHEGTQETLKMLRSKLLNIE
jgi:hypothetical protein